VACARKAIVELDPAFSARYELIVRPHFDRVLRQRWPHEELLASDINDSVVN
jgi:hypothetical protein